MVTLWKSALVWMHRFDCDASAAAVRGEGDEDRRKERDMDMKPWTEIRRISRLESDKVVRVQTSAGRVHQVSARASVEDEDVVRPH